MNLPLRQPPVLVEPGQLLPGPGRSRLRGLPPSCDVPQEDRESVLRRAGRDVTIVSVGVSVHHALEAAQAFESEGISAGVLDLRSVSPLDKTTVCEAVSQTGRLLVVDEDYEGFGLSGEIAAVLLEAGVTFRYERVCTQDTIPFDRRREDEALPNVSRICNAARALM